MKIIKKTFFWVFFGILPAFLFVVYITYIAAIEVAQPKNEEVNFEVANTQNGELIQSGTIFKSEQKEVLTFNNGLEIKLSEYTEIQFNSITREEIVLTLEAGKIWVNAMCTSAKITLKTKKTSLENHSGSFGAKYFDGTLEIFSGNGISWVGLLAEEDSTEAARRFALLDKTYCEIYESNLSEVFRKLLFSKLKKELKISKIKASDEEKNWIFDNMEQDLLTCINRKLNLEGKIKSEKKSFKAEVLSPLRERLTFNEKRKAQQALSQENYNIFMILDLNLGLSYLQKVGEFVNKNFELLNEPDFVKYKNNLILVQEFVLFLDEQEFSSESKEVFLSLLKDLKLTKKYLKSKQMTDLLLSFNQEKKDLVSKKLQKIITADLEILENKKEEGGNQEVLEVVEMWRNVFNKEKFMEMFNGEEIIEMEEKFENLALEVLAENTENYNLRLEFALRKLDLMKKIIEEIFEKQSLKNLQYAKKLLESYESLHIEEKTEDQKQRIQFAERILALDLKIQFLTSLAGSEHAISERAFEEFKRKVTKTMQITPIFLEQNITVEKYNVKLADASLRKFLVKDAKLALDNKRTVRFSCIYDIYEKTCENFKIMDYRKIITKDVRVELEEIKTFIKKTLYSDEKGFTEEAEENKGTKNPLPKKENDKEAGESKSKEVPKGKEKKEEEKDPLMDFFLKKRKK